MTIIDLRPKVSDPYDGYTVTTDYIGSEIERYAYTVAGLVKNKLRSVGFSVDVVSFDGRHYEITVAIPDDSHAPFRYTYHLRDLSYYLDDITNDVNNIVDQIFLAVGFIPSAGTTAQHTNDPFYSRDYQNSRMYSMDYFRGMYLIDDNEYLVDFNNTGSVLIYNKTLDSYVVLANPNRYVMVSAKSPELSNNWLPVYSFETDDEGIYAFNEWLESVVRRAKKNSVDMQGQQIPAAVKDSHWWYRRFLVRSDYEQYDVRPESLAEQFYFGIYDPWGDQVDLEGTGLIQDGLYTFDVFDNGSIRAVIDRMLVEGYVSVNYGLHGPEWEW